MPRAALAAALALLAAPAPAAPPDPAFSSAVACWHMNANADAAGRHPLKAVGKAAVGVRLEGRDLAESTAAGNDGLAARLDGGHLDAGQGTGGRLNLSGSALTFSARLRSPSGKWDAPLVSKHGGHDRLVFNLYSSAAVIGFEIGTRDKPGMTAVTVPLDRIGSADWHDFVGRYDGRRLQLFVDGVLADEAPASGQLRTGNTSPCLIGGEPAGRGVKSGWAGLVDHVALWDKALPDADIERLAGGAARVAVRRKRYAEPPPALAPRPDLYREALRPQFHFSARQWATHKLEPGQREDGWLNDVNGLVHHAGEYHLFAQRWNRCWVHAVSTDLVHWTELQPAFWEDNRFGTGVQSGGAVVDHDNTSGLSPDPKTPPMVAFWSGNDNRSQCIAYSLDNGRTWAKYAKNPVLMHPERDPKVFWHAPTKKWVMVLYGANSYFLFTSPNLLDWTELKGSVPDSFECPDLFQLPVDGDADKQKWVLVRGDGRYSVGDFNGVKFTDETPQMPCDQGPNFYATQSWGDIAGQPGRRVQIAWMRGGRYPGMPFNQQMSFPCDLTLRTTPAGVRLFRRPAKELAALHGKEHSWRDLALAAGEAKPLAVAGDLFRIVAEVEVPDGATLSVRVRGTPVTVTGRAVACRSKPAAVRGRVETVEILADRTSVEVFANNGEVTVSACMLPVGDRLELAADGGPVRVRSLRVVELKSAWRVPAKGRGATAPTSTAADTPSAP